jgi:hypothetical protein
MMHMLLSSPEIHIMFFCINMDISIVLKKHGYLSCIGVSSQTGKLTILAKEATSQKAAPELGRSSLCDIAASVPCSSDNSKQLQSLRWGTRGIMRMG